MEIRLALKEEIDVIMHIYKEAKIFMRNCGNGNQWKDGYPNKALIEKDIEEKQCYVCVCGDDIAGVFVFKIGEDPTYRIIENGKWSKDALYGCIHRIASARTYKGVAKCCFDFCVKQIAYLRVDTHQDNLPMRHFLESYGFCACGTIYVEDGSPRIAYDYQR